MSSFDLPPVPGGLVRPLVVAIAHIPIVVFALCVMPLLMFLVVCPAPQRELALRILIELRTWSRDVVGAANGTRAR